MASNGELVGWKDILSCPFCSSVAVECIRLPHSEPTQDCGVCACAECARVVLRDIAGGEHLACPRCRHPINVAQLKHTCSRFNHRDPLIARLLADVDAQCPHCDMKGTVSTVTSHATKHHCVQRYLALLHSVDATTKQPLSDQMLMMTPWLDAFVALHAVAPTEAGHYLTEWMEMATTPTQMMLCALVVRFPTLTLDACASHPFSRIIPMYEALTKNPPRTDEYDAVCSRMVHQIMDGFTSDDPDVLLDLKANLSATAMTQLFVHPPAPGLVGLRSFAARLETMETGQTFAHAELLMHCVSIFDIDSEERTALLSGILSLSGLDNWWSDELVALSICEGIESVVLDPLWYEFTEVWRCRKPKWVPSHAYITATLVSDLHGFDFWASHVLQVCFPYA